MIVLFSILFFGFTIVFIVRGIALMIYADEDSIDREWRKFNKTLNRENPR